MDMNKLNSVIELQILNLKKFRDVLLTHQKAIVGNNSKTIEESILSEERLLKNINTVEKERSNLIELLCKQNGFNISSNSLTKLIQELEKRDQAFELTKLKKMQTSIKNLVNEIAKINWQNKVLIDNAKYLIRETVATIVSQNNNSLLDRRL